MPINPDAVGSKGEPSEKSWTSKDSLLYALGVGCGTQDLQFTTENTSGVDQRALPTMAVVLGMGGGGGMANIGTFNPAMLVHGEQGVELLDELPVQGKVSTVSEITGIWDKGKGAVVQTTSESTDVASGKPLFRTTSSIFIRGEGGWGGDRGPSGPAEPVPSTPADEKVTYTTREDQALIYRLSGDRNPLHSDPKFAEMGGFPKPILHGLCTYGFTGRALLSSLCDNDPARFTSMAGRFSSPVFPGESLTVEIWRTGDGAASFHTLGEDGRVVLDAGRATYK
jgi:acyl dehydratase